MRAIHLRNGMALEERLIDRSDEAMRYVYTVHQSPLPLAYHRSGVALLALDGGRRTRAVWQADFALHPDAGVDQAAFAEGIAQGVMEVGFLGISRVATAASKD
ncbi:MAG: hypothetical protein HC855_01635 [Rhizobiales bacterium]|nr:hypothetical protein [Hyphomicrobiales bacterium]